jgi:antitoxin component YwqK of YwqJK toxin-antitoxin module
MKSKYLKRLNVLLLVVLVSCNNTESVEQKDDIVVSTDYLKTDSASQDFTVAKEIVKNGEFIEKYPNGKIQTEGWHDENGKRTGKWFSYYDTGSIWSELDYENGLKNGKSVVYYPNGNKRYTGEYKDDLKTGHWIFYAEDGSITNEEDY